MKINIIINRSSFLSKTISMFVLTAFLFNSIIVPGSSYAQQILSLPLPGTMIPLSPGFTPTLVKGIKLYPDNPLRFDFIVDIGDSGLKGEELKKETSKIIKYFLTTLTVPEDDLWVNLSPYEKDKIVPNSFGETEMGRDLLAQDYILKQITASLIYPENELGKEFWEKVYKKAQETFGTTEIPVNTFNKVWIIPDRAEIYVHGDRAFVADSYLKVLLEEDYLALTINKNNEGLGTNKLLDIEIKDSSKISSQIIKEIIIPELEKEINTGKNFTDLRQIYNSMILATWFKQNLKENIVNKVYSDKNKIAGIESEDKNVKEKIYQQYLEAFKKGAYDLIKEEYDPESQQVTQRRYFSGGFFGSRLAKTIKETKDGSIFSVKMKDSLLAGLVFLAGVTLSNVTTSNAAQKSSLPAKAAAELPQNIVSHTAPYSEAELYKSIRASLGISGISVSDDIIAGHLNYYRSAVGNLSSYWSPDEFQSSQSIADVTTKMIRLSHDVALIRGAISDILRLDEKDLLRPPGNVSLRVGNAGMGVAQTTEEGIIFDLPEVRKADYNELINIAYHEVFHWSFGLDEGIVEALSKYVYSKSAGLNPKDMRISYSWRYSQAIMEAVILGLDLSPSEELTSLDLAYERGVIIQAKTYLLDKHSKGKAKNYSSAVKKKIETLFAGTQNLKGALSFVNDRSKFSGKSVASFLLLTKKLGELGYSNAQISAFLESKGITSDLLKLNILGVPDPKKPNEKITFIALTRDWDKLNPDDGREISEFFGKNSLHAELVQRVMLQWENGGPYLQAEIKDIFDSYYSDLMNIVDLSREGTDEKTIQETADRLQTNVNRYWNIPGFSIDGKASADTSAYVEKIKKSLRGDGFGFNITPQYNGTFGTYLPSVSLRKIIETNERTASLNGHRVNYRELILGENFIKTEIVLTQVEGATESESLIFPGELRRNIEEVHEDYLKYKQNRTRSNLSVPARTIIPISWKLYSQQWGDSLNPADAEQKMVAHYRLHAEQHIVDFAALKTGTLKLTLDDKRYSEQLQKDALLEARVIIRQLLDKSLPYQTLQQLSLARLMRINGEINEYSIAADILYFPLSEAAMKDPKISTKIRTINADTAKEFPEVFEDDLKGQGIWRDGIEKLDANEIQRMALIFAYENPNFNDMLTPEQKSETEIITSGSRQIEGENKEDYKDRGELIPGINSIRPIPLVTESDRTFLSWNGQDLTKLVIPEGYSIGISNTVTEPDQSMYADPQPIELGKYSAVYKSGPLILINQAIIKIGAQKFRLWVLNKGLESEEVRFGLDYENSIVITPNEEKHYFIGRYSDNDFIVPPTNGSASRRHCSIILLRDRTSGQYFFKVEDLNSTLGTLVYPDASTNIPDAKIIQTNLNTANPEHGLEVAMGLTYKFLIKGEEFEFYFNNETLFFRDSNGFHKELNLNKPKEHILVLDNTKLIITKRGANLVTISLDPDTLSPEIDLPVKITPELISPPTTGVLKPGLNGYEGTPVGTRVPKDIEDLLLTREKELGAELPSAESFSTLEELNNSPSAKEKEQILLKSLFAGILGSINSPASLNLRSSLIDILGLNEDNITRADEIAALIIDGNIDDPQSLSENERKAAYQALLGQSPVWTNTEGNLVTLPELIIGKGGLKNDFFTKETLDTPGIHIALGARDYAGKILEQEIAMKGPLSIESQEKILVNFIKSGSEAKTMSYQTPEGLKVNIFLDIEINGFGKALTSVLHEISHGIINSLLNVELNTSSTDKSFADEGMAENFSVYCLQRLAQLYKGLPAIKTIEQRRKERIIKEKKWSPAYIYGYILFNELHTRLGGSSFASQVIPEVLEIIRGKNSIYELCGLLQANKSSSRQKFPETILRNFPERKDQAMLSLDNNGRLLYNKYKAGFGYLKEDNPAALYLQGIIDKIFPDISKEERPTFKILASHGIGINALMLSNGVGIITPEMLEFVQNEEELIFLILHEMNHFRREHIKKSLEVSERGSLRQDFGLARYQEYESDVAAFWMMGDKGFNNFGAISWLQRMKLDENGWGAVHGSDTDRLLNVETITFLADLPKLSKELLTPIPAEIKQLIAKLPIGNKADGILSRDYSPAGFSRRQEFIGQADIHLLKNTMPFIYKRIISLKKASAEFSSEQGRSSNSAKQSNEKQILGLLDERLSVLLQSNLSRIPNEKQVILRYFILTAAFGMPLYKQISGVNKIDRILKEYRDLFNEESIIKTITEALTDPKFAQLDLVFNTADLEDFVIQSLHFTLNEELFTDKSGHLDYKEYFGQALKYLKFAEEYADKHGTEPLNAEAVWSSIISNAIEALYLQENPQDAAAILPQLLQYLSNQPAPKVSILSISEKLRGSSLEETQIEEIINSYRQTASDKTIEIEPSLLILKDELFEWARLFFAKTNEFEKKSIRNKMEHKRILFGPRDDKILNHQLPAEPLLRNFYDFRKHNFDVLSDIISRNNLDDIINALILIKQTLPNESFTKNDFNDLLSYIQNIFFSSKRYSADPLKFTIDSIHFSQILERFDSPQDLSITLLDIAIDPLLLFVDEGEDALYLTIEEIGKVAEAISNVKLAQKRVKVDYTVPEKELNPDEMENFRAILLPAIHKDLMSIDDPDYFFEEINSLLGRYNMPNSGNINGSFLNMALSMFEDIIKKGLGFLDQKQEDARTTDRLFLLSFFIQDVYIKNYLQEFVLNKKLESLNFNEAMEYIFDRYPKNRASGMPKAIEYLIEQKAQIPEDFEKLKTRAKDMLVITSPNALESLGNLVGLDAFMEIIFKNNSKLLNLLLKTASDDRQFKSYLLDIWYPSLGLSPDLSQNKPFKPGQANDSAGYYYPLDFILNLFYRMDFKTRYALLRKLLMSKNGVITKELTRRGFLDNFIKEHIQADNDGAFSIIEEVLGEIVTEASDDRLYFAISDLLLDRIANPPETPSDWRITAHNKIKKEFPEESPNLKENLTKHLLANILGRSLDETEPASVVDKFLEFIPPDYYKKESKTMSTMDFTLQMAKSFRTPGVRFLQLLGQFVDIPEDYRKQFSEIYDSVKGQSRLSAYETIKREMPEYLKEIKRFGQRVGGGSMVSVYEVDLLDGSKEVVRVLNPNVKYDMENTIELLKTILRNLKETHPKYAKAAPLLEDLKAWIEGELNDLSYFEDDAAFKKRNNGYNPKGFKYSILVPENKGGTAKVKRESFVEGKTLTDLTAVSEKDKKEIVSLITRNYFDQIKGGLSDLTTSTLVHSDVHKGNFIITPDGKVAIIDRNFYLKLSLKDRLFLKNLLEEGTNEEKIKQFIKYLLDQENNKALRESYGENGAVSDLAQRISAALDTNNLENSILNIMLQLRSAGFKIPLKISLLIKNFNSLNQLAKESGFNSLIEARDYHPDRSMLSEQEEEFGKSQNKGQISDSGSTQEDIAMLAGDLPLDKSQLPLKTLRALESKEFLKEIIDGMLSEEALAVEADSRIVAKPGQFHFGPNVYSEPQINEHENKHFREYLEIAVTTLSDELKPKAREALEELLSRAELQSLTPRHVEDIVYEFIKFISANKQPLLKIKTAGQQAALKLLPEFERQLAAARNPYAKLQKAVEISAKGNRIGASQFRENALKGQKELEGYIETLLTEPLNLKFIEGLKLFLKLQGGPRKVLYIYDNIIENVFDLPLIRWLLENGHYITLAGKEEEADNDVTFEDINRLLSYPEVKEYLGEERMARQIKVISSGAKTRSSDLRKNRITPEFADSFLNSEVIFSKGEGNRGVFKTAGGTTRGVYTIAVAKTAFELPGVNVGDGIVELIPAHKENPVFPAELLGDELTAFLTAKDEWYAQVKPEADNLASAVDDLKSAFADPNIDDAQIKRTAEKIFQYAQKLKALVDGMDNKKELELLFRTVTGRGDSEADGVEFDLNNILAPIISLSGYAAIKGRPNLDENLFKIFNDNLRRITELMGLLPKIKRALIGRYRHESESFNVDITIPCLKIRDSVLKSLSDADPSALSEEELSLMINEAIGDIKHPSAQPITNAKRDNIIRLLSQAAKRTRETYSRLAGKYTESRGESPAGNDLETLEAFVKMVRDSRPVIDRQNYQILDIGTGSRDLSWLAQQQGIAVTGIDIAKPLLDLIRANPDISKTIALHLMDMQQLGFADKIFDGVRIHASLHHLPLVDKGYGADLAIIEAERVLKDGGVIQILVKAEAEGRTGFMAIDTQENLGYRFYQFYSPELLKNLLERNGLKVIGNITEWEDTRGEKNLIVYAKRSEDTTSNPAFASEVITDTSILSTKDFTYNISTNELYHKGKRVKLLASHGNNDIFEFNNFVIRVFRRYPQTPKAIETIKEIVARVNGELPENNRFFPNIIESGFIKSHSGYSDHQYILAEKISGDSTDLLVGFDEGRFSNIEGVRALDPTKLNAIADILKTLVDHNVFIVDFFKPSNIIFENKGPETPSKIWLPDYDHITRNPEATKSGLIKLYIRQLNFQFLMALWDEIDPQKIISKHLEKMLAAALAEEQGNSNDVGGIDLTPANLKINTHGNTPDIKVDAEDLKSMEINGFVPIILEITPITTLPLLLGETDKEPIEPLAMAR
ncbi:MAG: DUF89 family protein [Candidatus Omnitrophica bacterium]|nr:DUF89 family protein [Candidatus Omnitrophota bacterium]